MEDNVIMKPEMREVHPDDVFFINIIVTGADVNIIADAFGVSRDAAWDRMSEWSKHIMETMSGYTMEQVTDVIRHGQP
jgi:oligoribonuclease (3'-5' exoribonuclease)